MGVIDRNYYVWTWEARHSGVSSWPFYFFLFPMFRPCRIYAFCAIAFVLILSFAKWSRLSLDANSLVCPSPAGPLTLVAPPPPPEPIVITLVLMGESFAHEGSVAIKSAIMHTSRPLHFHLICTQDNIPYLEKKFTLFTRPAYDIQVSNLNSSLYALMWRRDSQVTYYPLTSERVRERGHRAGIGENWSALTKVFMHELLVDINKTIYIDTDMIFLVDPLELVRMSSPLLLPKFTPFSSGMTLNISGPTHSCHSPP